MKAKVLYYSRTGNTKKIAETIAQALNEKAEVIPPQEPCEDIDLLFLGSAVYGGKIDNKVKNFIITLDESKVKNVALFSTCGFQDTAIQIMSNLLKAQGIKVMEESFLCKGRFFLFFNFKHPCEEDIKKAQDFVERTLEKVKE